MAETPVERWQREQRAREFARAELQRRLDAGELKPGVYEVLVAEEVEVVRS
jgi:hypothetical protein